MGDSRQSANAPTSPFGQPSGREPRHRYGPSVANPPVDPDAFDAFEAAGWEEKAVAYERFFDEITDRVVGPLLAAASVGVGARVLDVATGPGWVAARAAERGASVPGTGWRGCSSTRSQKREPCRPRIFHAAATSSGSPTTTRSPRRSAVRVWRAST